MNGRSLTKMSKLVVIILIAGLLAACASNSSNSGADQTAGNQKNGETKTDAAIELRMSWWGSQNRHDRTLQVIDLFQQQHPNIKIIPEFSGWDGYMDKLATQAAGRNLPDIIQMGIEHIGEYVARDLIADLQPYVQSGVLNLSDVDEVYLSGGRVGEGLYAVNIGTNALAMAVDPSMFAQAGVPLPQPGYTWDDFMDVARSLKQQLGSDIYVRPLSEIDGIHAFRHYLRNHGYALYANDGGLGYDDDKLLADFFRMWDTLYKEGVLAPPELTSTEQGLENSLIVNGQSPNHMIWTNQIVALTQAAGRPLEMVLLPGIEGGQHGHYLKPGQFLAATTHSKHPEAVAAFIDFFTNSLEANDILAGERGVPIATNVREHLYTSLDDTNKLMFDYLDTVAQYAGDVPYDPPGSGSLLQAFDRIFDGIRYGQHTPEQAAELFRNEANSVLKAK